MTGISLSDAITNLEKLRKREKGGNEGVEEVDDVEEGTSSRVENGGACCCIIV